MDHWATAGIHAKVRNAGNRSRHMIGRTLCRCFLFFGGKSRKTDSAEARPVLEGALVYLHRLWWSL